ncbi:MAG: hypothetical protein IRZ23_07930, partial [Acetobacteraceae bacterium]|nr:hypothetical protein [Acetobacteraceae bacterium]
LTPYRRFLAAAGEVLRAGRNLSPPAEREVKAVIGHALCFHTWRSLAIDQGCDDAEIVRLLCLWVQSVGTHSRRSEPSPFAAK